jgi:uncharacterized membrane protein (DUF2068 family)
LLPKNKGQSSILPSFFLARIGALSCRLDSVPSSNDRKLGEVRQMDKLSHKYGLRTVAVLEALKGAAVVALCIILLSLLHKDLDVVVDHITEWLRINPDSRVADWFYELADRTTGRGIWTAVSVGFVYSLGRFVEAYGLWNERNWAEWFAVISGAIYVPFEVFALVAHPHWTKLAVLLINIGVVLYILRILMENRRERCAQEPLRD